MKQVKIKISILWVMVMCELTIYSLADFMPFFGGKMISDTGAVPVSLLLLSKKRVSAIGVINHIFC